MCRMLIVILLLLWSTSAISSESETSSTVPIESLQPIAHQFDSYYATLKEPARRAVLANAYLETESVLGSLLQDFSGSETTIQNLLAIYFDLLILSADSQGWTELAEYLRIELANNLSQKALQDLRIEVFQYFEPQHDDYITPHEATIEALSELMISTYGAFAKRHSLSNDASIATDYALALRVAEKGAEEMATDLPQRISANMQMEKVLRFGANLTLVAKLSYDRAFLDDHIASTGVLEDYFLFEFLMQPRRGVCSSPGLLRSLIDHGGSVTYKYIFQDGSHFTDNVIAFCAD